MPVVLGAFAGLLLVIFFLLPDPYWFDIAIRVQLVAVAAIGLNVLLGFAGQISVGHAALLASAAYISAIASTAWQLPVPIAIGLAVVAVTVFSWLLAKPLLRLHGHALTIATLGLGMIVQLILINESKLSGGPEGMIVPPLSVGGWVVDTPRQWYLLASVVLVLAVAFSLNLFKSPAGRALRALNGSEIAARASGVDAASMKVRAFAGLRCIRSGFRSIGRALWRLHHPWHGRFHALHRTRDHGRRRRSRIDVRRRHGGHSADRSAAAPRRLGRVRVGHVRAHPHANCDLHAEGHRAYPGRVPTQSHHPKTLSCDDFLDVRGLSKAFGGVKAVDDVSFAVAEGAVHSLIGPNGAGKTTLFNLVTGLYAPTSGAVFLDDQEITGLTPERLAALGVRRSFQNLQVCRDMSALENVMIGAHLSLNSHLVAGMFMAPSMIRADQACARAAVELLEFVGVERYANTHAAHMPFGALKRLEVARAMAGRPRLLLLDEPAAGLNQTERVELQRLIVRIAERGLTVLLVEHDMKMVMNLSDHIVVLANGRKLAEGTPAEVRIPP